MNPLVFGVAAGLCFGLAAVLVMLPLSFPDKGTALAAAFANRFAIGFLIPLVRMPMPPWIVGSLVGLLVSVPDAVIVKAYAPIVGLGVLGGALIGWLSGKWVRQP